MPSVALFTDITSGNAALRSKGAIDATAGWSATIFDDNNIATQDVSLYDVVAIVRSEWARRDAIGAALLATGKPILIGSTEASNPIGPLQTSAATAMGIMPTVEVVESASGHSTFNVSPGATHPIIVNAGVSGSVAPFVGATWIQYAEGAYAGTVLAWNDYVTPGGAAVGTAPAMLALESNLIGYAHRIVWSSGFYANQGEYTSGGQALVSSTLDWLINAVPEPEVLAINTIQTITRSSLTEPAVFGFLGSSTTAGTGPSNPDNAYVPRVARRLQNTFALTLNTPYTPSAAAASPPATPGFYMVNGGIGGARSGDYAPTATLDDLATAGTDIYVHAIGANDHNANINPVTYKSNVLGVINSIDARNPNAVHVLFHQQQRPDATSTTYQWSEYKTKLVELETAMPSRRIVVDASDEFLEKGVPGADPENLVTADGIHVNDEGHNILATVLLRELNIDFQMRVMNGTTEIAVEILGIVENSALVDVYLNGAQIAPPAPEEPEPPAGTPILMATYDFATLNASFVETGITAGSVTKDDGSPAVTSSPGYSTDPVGRMTNADSLRFVITPGAGQTFTATNFSFKVAKGGTTSTRGIRWEYSANGGASWNEFYNNSAINAVRPNPITVSVDLPAAFSSESLIFRAFASTGGSTETVEVDDITLTGHVTATV